MFLRNMLPVSRQHVSLCIQQQTGNKLVAGNMLLVAGNMLQGIMLPWCKRGFIDWLIDWLIDVVYLSIYQIIFFTNHSLQIGKLGYILTKMTEAFIFTDIFKLNIFSSPNNMVG